jgi:hypothetical protein
VPVIEEMPVVVAEQAIVEQSVIEFDEPREAPKDERPAPRRGRKTAAKKAPAGADQVPRDKAQAAAPSVDPASTDKPVKPSRKSSSRARPKREAAAPESGR